MQVPAEACKVSPPHLVPFRAVYLRLALPRAVRLRLAPLRGAHLRLALNRAALLRLALRSARGPPSISGISKRISKVHRFVFVRSCAILHI